ncbi:hypothetical protein DL96DRAFT_1604976 [Flagelloscypha sp. PMI_526]|nr:hypothetical protein DL96DRAFT_1604976 [Flagelloscypha sp. PMI_526]
MTTAPSVLITGCTAGGMGDALALEYHSKGYRVIATSRKLESVKALADKGIETLALDVTSSSSIQEAKVELQKRLNGKLNILVNNAGIAYPFSVADLTMEAVRELYNVNLFGAIEMTHEFLPLLLAADRAVVVFTASILAFAPMPFNAIYNSSKAALISFGDTLRVELSPFNVKVINVIPGSVATNIMKPVELPANSIYSPIKAEYQDRRIDHLQDNAIPAVDYAKAVVAESLRSNPRRWVWKGGNASLLWFCTTFLPKSLVEKILSDKYGVSKLAAIIKRGETKSKLA